MDDLFTGLSILDYDRTRVEADEEEEEEVRLPVHETIATDSGGGDLSGDRTTEYSHHVDAPSNTRNFTTSTSSVDSISSDLLFSLETFRSPKIDYDAQKLVAVIGREFDEPFRICWELQKLTPNKHLSNFAVTKFAAFTIARSTLRRCTFNWRELNHYDLVCLCYNASETRIMLTGVHGFYTILLGNIEGSRGSNKVAFIITKYTEPVITVASIYREQEDPSLLISPHLNRRLSSQGALRSYLDSRQILSWSNKPCHTHTDRLDELTDLEPNPTGLQTCVVL